MREIPICTPMGSNVIKWVYSDYSDSSSTTTPIVGEGGQGSFEVVALGGTFDHLHAGHKILLTMASSLATRKVIVGVSDDELLGKKQYREWLEGIKERIEQVERFLELVRPGVKHEVVPLKVKSTFPETG
jgi:cytidyltransferase-like protein